MKTSRVVLWSGVIFLIVFAEDGLIERTSDDKSVCISRRLCKRASETIATSRTLAVRGEIFVNKCGSQTKMAADV